jgi:hypothetical protein
MSRLTLFLDLDGVLHADAVFRGKRGLELRAPGHLLMHAGILIAMLERHPEVEIVLSTSWVRVFGYSKTLSKLPHGLRERVTGATWHRHMKTDSGYDPFSHMTRFEQIYSHVRRNGIKLWLAIDDLHSGEETWPQEFKDHLILCNGELGLGDQEVQGRLMFRLAEYSKNSWDSLTDSLDKFSADFMDNRNQLHQQTCDE